MVELVSLLLDGPVAAGTIGLAILTVYQLVRDRRDALRREMADRVYVPMRKAALGWQNPESLSNVPATWTELEENVPYLAMKVPSDLRKLFEKADAIDHETWTYTGPTVGYIQSKSWAPGPNARTTIRITKEGQFLGEIYTINIWKRGKTFEQYVAEFMKRNHPLVNEWNLELWADVPAPAGAGTIQQKVGGTEESIESVKKLFEFLESKPEAVTYRAMYRERAEIGAKAAKRIEKELRKRVAPQSSSPAKEPGNPFG